MAPNFEPNTLPQEVIESVKNQRISKELSENNLKCFIIAYKQYVKELTIIERKKLLQEINEDFETSCIISDYYNPNLSLMFSGIRHTILYVVPDFILKKIKIDFKEETVQEKEFIVDSNNFETFLNKESKNIDKLEEIEKNENKIQELKIKHIIRFVAIIYDDHIDWSGSCQDLAYCLSHSIGGSAGEIIQKIKGKIFYSFKDTSLEKKLNECNDRKKSIISEPKYYNKFLPYLKTLL